jgi:hypothetical protein
MTFHDYENNSERRKWKSYSQYKVQYIRETYLYRQRKELMLHSDGCLGGLCCQVASELQDCV